MSDGVRSGVADYYAILGVSDHLTYKHTQKQTDANQEEERFLREIVQVVIIEQQQSSFSPQHQNADENANGTDTSTAAGGTELDPSSILRSSPSLAEATEHDCPTGSGGWNVIETTLPAAEPGFALLQGESGSSRSDKNVNVQLWNKSSRWDANLEFDHAGLRAELWAHQGQADQAVLEAAQKGIRRKVETKLKRISQQLHPIKKNCSGGGGGTSHCTNPGGAAAATTKFRVAHQRRQSLECDARAIADLQVAYVRLHRTIVPSSPDDDSKHAVASPRLFGLAGQLLKGYQSQQTTTTAGNPINSSSSGIQGTMSSESQERLVLLEDYLPLPESFEEWSIPESFKWIRDPAHPVPRPISSRTMLFAHSNSSDGGGGGLSGVDAVVNGSVEAVESESSTIDPELLLPKLMLGGKDAVDSKQFVHVPVLALRRQRVGDEERYHEDAAIVDVAVTFTDRDGQPVLPDCIGDEEEEDESSFSLLGKTAWTSSTLVRQNSGVGLVDDSGGEQVPSQQSLRNKFGMPLLLIRRNLAFGFCDAAFCTRVLGRFPFENYKGLPLPEEELPMFCYPTGCRLYRTQYSDAPLPQYYGFVVKNERGDSIYVSCVSFMEPLSSAKVNQLSEMSSQRRRSSLPHRRFHDTCEQRLARKSGKSLNAHAKHDSSGSSATTEADSNFLLTAFDDMTTFENKTICLVSRYPFWSGFRKFLSHLHIISCSSSDLPLERYISHLLLTVPLPHPGDPDVLVPLPALNETMVISMPPEKDFPLLDLPYHRLFACLDIKTIVTIVLGLLALERKVIVMSTRPSLVLDVCELLRSLLFPFELCAPYVPRLTEPFKSSLGFPGALFVGIHDDGEPSGLASMVKNTYPEDSIIVNLDTGEVDCDGDRYEILTKVWDTVPKSIRSVLVSELETLCRDASIVDGQEPLDSLLDSAFCVDLPDAVEAYDVNAKSREPLDDRAIRDAFLRFFCSVLAGYEQFLVVPDADFLVSGNEWFDAQGFLASVPAGKAAFLNSLVATQLFQSFIQRRTEASDVHCLLFDECLAEFHSSPVPYGRLGGDVEAVAATDGTLPQMLYSLLVDQSASTPAGYYDQTAIGMNRSIDASEADSSFSLNLSRASASVADSSIRYSDSVVNTGGDLVTAPSRQDLPVGKKFIYFVEGNPMFPYRLQPELFLPHEPSSWEIKMSKAPNPLLARSERELEEANRRRRMATSYRGRSQRRCLWQLPKLMGSHFLGSWLLCIPVLVSQPHLSNEQQSRYLLRSLGALRILRSKQRIVPDEAAYRALMVACGRTRSDRRVELVKVFGLLRSDGIFPSAVTLGQYTKALAEGYSKRSSGSVQAEDYGVEVTESGFDRQTHRDFVSSLHQLDSSLGTLESQGKRWRNKQNAERTGVAEGGKDAAADANKKRGGARSWLPVTYSSSFLLKNPEPISGLGDDVLLVAIWSRTRCCSNCGYIPLEEEIQAGWDIVEGDNEIPGAVACPRCDSLIVPLLGIKEMSIEEAYAIEITDTAGRSSPKNLTDVDLLLPPPICPTIEMPGTSEDVSYVTYISPSTLRASLEHYVEEFGEEVLQRERLKQLDPEVFYNFWWYCARFSLPLPLPTAPQDAHSCAFVAWDRSSAERGCLSAAKVLSQLIRPRGFDNLPSPTEESTQSEMFDDTPLLSRFNLQGFHSTVWDHPDLSKLLVTLVEACEKRDFRPVIECALQSNLRRRDGIASLNDSRSDATVGYAVSPTDAEGGVMTKSVELDVYRAILYLAKYQCTTAFHTFFPAALKPCKGYHFWCAIGTPLPIFDRLLRDAARRMETSKDQTMAVPIPDVSDVALGFRCVFGHLI